MKNKIRSQNGIQQFVVLLLTIILLLTGCSGGGYSSMPTIEGKDLEEAARELERANVESVIERKAEKYKRHFGEGLYFEDFSKPKKELSQKFHQHLEKKLQKFISEKAKFLEGAQSILRTEVEYVNADVKAYINQEKTAEEIIDNPQSIMSLRITWYVFGDYPTDYYEESDAFSTIKDYMEDEFSPYYMDHGVEPYEFYLRIHPKELLQKYPLEQLQNEQHIDILLQNEEMPKVSFYIVDNEYYETRLHKGDTFRARGLFYDNPVRSKENLKKKYNIEFDEMNHDWYCPKGKPELFFKATMDAEKDHFQSLMYQYLLNKKVRKVIDESDLKDRVVFLVTAELDNSNRDGEITFQYDFGKGFDENHFLREGYTGYAAVNFIYLDDKQAVENLSQDGLIARSQALRKEVKEKLVKPLHEEIEFGKGSYEGEDGQWYSKGGIKDAYFTTYYVDDYERKVAIDLFKKMPLTERAAKPEARSIAEAFSLEYRTRAETMGFHFLDIFGKKRQEAEYSF